MRIEKTIFYDLTDTEALELELHLKRLRGGGCGAADCSAGRSADKGQDSAEEAKPRGAALIPPDQGGQFNKIGWLALSVSGQAGYVADSLCELDSDTFSQTIDSLNNAVDQLEAAGWLHLETELNPAEAKAVNTLEHDQSNTETEASDNG